MTTIKIGGNVRVLDTEWGREIGLVGELVEVTKVEAGVTDALGVRVKAGGRTELLINDALDTEFEVVA